jgi:hypothetical protein
MGGGWLPVPRSSSITAAKGQGRPGDFARNGLVFAQRCEMMLKDMLRLIERDDLVRREGESAPMR